MHNIDESKEFFSKNDFKKIKVEDNFFSLGTRRFYENPFTEVLAYMLDSETQFTGRKEFIEILLGDSLPENSLNSLIEFAKTSAQASTRNGNFIDLLLYNNSDIVVFENKIFHSAHNPFDDYVNHIRQKYPHHNHYFVLLSYKKEFPVENWNYISIQEKFSLFNTLYTFEYTNKWDYFIHDFITHFSNKKITMNQEEKEFYEEHFAKIISAGNNLNNFFLEIGKSFVEDNELTRFELVSNWNSETKAIRFYPFSDKSNVVLIFELNGQFNTSVYYYKDFHAYNDSIYAEVGSSKYRNWKEGSVCCYTLYAGNSFTTLKKALDECKNQIQIMKKLYGKSGLEK